MGPQNWEENEETEVTFFYEERLREMGAVWRRGSSWKNLTGVYKHLKGGCKENGARFLLVVPSARIQGNSYKLKSRGFPFTTRKHLCSLLVTEPWEHIAQTNCGVSVLGDVQKPTGCGTGQLAMNGPAGTGVVPDGLHPSQF